MKNQNKGKWGLRYRNYDKFQYAAFFPTDLVVAVAVSVTQLCPTLCEPVTVALQAPLAKGFSRQEYWSGLLCPPPGDLPGPGIEPRSPALQADSLLSEPLGKPIKTLEWASMLSSTSWSGLFLD